MGQPDGSREKSSNLATNLAKLEQKYLDYQSLDLYRRLDKYRDVRLYKKSIETMNIFIY